MATKTGEFSERLKAILDLRGMTQSKLAKVSGVSKSSISRYISGAWKGNQGVRGSHPRWVTKKSLAFTQFSSVFARLSYFLKWQVLTGFDGF